ncbi:hypothetical protein ACLOJK_015147 [Asimina triloba]
MATEEALSYSHGHAHADEEEEEEEEGEECSTHVCNRLEVTCGACKVRWDPRAKWVQEWNRVFLLVCATGLAVDPLFFYALSISDTCMCLFLDGWFAITVTALRCMTDALHLCNMWLQLKVPHEAAMRRPHAASEGPLQHHHSSAGRTSSSSGTAFRLWGSKRVFFFNLFVILPVPQVTISCILNIFTP